MKKFKFFTIIIFGVLLAKHSVSQNILLNVITQNSGVVNKNGVIYFEVTINNTSPNKAISMYKIRPQINYPSTLVSISETENVLPKGWTITSNKYGVVFLSNGTDVIPENASRTILIALKGIALGGPTTISANLLFSNGIAPGTTVGSPTLGDNIADNASSSTIKVQ